MNEAEKRAGLVLSAAVALKPAIDARYARESTVRRTVIVKVDNDDFSPNPEAMIDIKTKLIGDRSLRQTRLVARRHGALFAMMKLLGFAKYIFFSTVRTTCHRRPIVLLHRANLTPGVDPYIRNFLLTRLERVNVHNFLDEDVSANMAVIANVSSHGVGYDVTAREQCVIQEHVDDLICELAAENAAT